MAVMIEMLECIRSVDQILGSDPHKTDIRFEIGARGDTQ